MVTVNVYVKAVLFFNSGRKVNLQKKKKKKKKKKKGGLFFLGGGELFFKKVSFSPSKK